MTGVPHDCTVFDPDCPRCDLSHDEIETAAERSARERRERARAHIAEARRRLHATPTKENQ